jgi:imidazolonepropionase-like amidohydrolase
VALVRAGMMPLEALQASTRDAAEFMGRLATEGTVEEGKTWYCSKRTRWADIANTRRVAAVVLRGRLVSGPELQQLR